MGNDKTSCIIVKRHEMLFRVIMQKMNAEIEIDKEAEDAEKIGKEVNAILKCEKFSAAMPECKHCHAIWEGRKGAVRLILKAQKFEREMNLATYSLRHV